MDAAAVFHDIISRHDEDSESGSKKEDKDGESEELDMLQNDPQVEIIIHEPSSSRSDDLDGNIPIENTMKIMALFEINKPLQSAIIFESDNESSYSSSESHFETNTQIKRKKDSCAKTKDKRSNLDTDERVSNHLNKVKFYPDETTTDLQVKNNAKDSMSGTPKIIDFHSKDVHTNDKRENEDSSISYIQEKIKTETNLEETNMRLEGKLQNYNNLYDTTKEVQTKINRQHSKGHDSSFEFIENQYDSNYPSVLHEKDTSRIEDTNKIRNPIQEENTKSCNSTNNEIGLALDSAAMNENNVTRDVIQNTCINVNFQTIQNNSVLSDFQSSFGNISTSISYTNNNIAMPNSPPGSYENSRTVNLLVREILNIMYDMINFKRYNDVLEKENTENSVRKNVLEEFEKYLTTSLSNSWRSVVSHILNKENITYSFIFSILSKGQVLANNENNSFNELYFTDILKYFMKQYINERKASEAVQHYHSYHHNILPANNSTNINFNQDNASINKNYMCNNGPVANSKNDNVNQASIYQNNNDYLTTERNVVQMNNNNNANGNYTAKQTNGNVLSSQFSNGTPYQRRVPNNIYTDKNKPPIVKNVNFEFDSTASNIQAFNAASPIVSQRTTINNSLTQHSTSSRILPTTEKKNTDDKYQNTTQGQLRHYLSVNEIDKLYQYDNSHKLKSNKSTQVTSSFSGNVKNNSLEALPNYQTIPQINYNITQNQFNYNSKNYTLLSNRNVSYRSHHQRHVPYRHVRHDLYSQQRGPPSRKLYPHIISKSVGNSRVPDSVHYAQPAPQMQTNYAYAAKQDYRLNYTNYETNIEAYQTGISTSNQEQARSSISRDSGFMSPSTSYEQSVPPLPDTATTSTSTPHSAPIPDRPCTTMAPHPCVVCGRSTTQKCSRCLSIYLCSNICLERAWISHSCV